QGAPARVLPGRRGRPGHGDRLGAADAAQRGDDHRGPRVGFRTAVAAGPDGVAGAARLERAFREEWAAVVATLARRLGDLQAAEDAAAEAFAAAAGAWARGGVPPKPG